MRWMHISDIHMNKEFNDAISNILRKKLPKFIEDNNLKVDYLFITGDYRDASYMKDKTLKENPKVQAENVAEYIEELADVLKIKYDHVYLVPGNHDLHRKEDKECIAKIKNQYKNSKSFENYRGDLLSRFEFFYKIEDVFHPYTNKAFHRFYKCDDADILCLNTALLCDGDEKPGELIIGTKHIEEIVDKTNSNTPLFVLAHHDLEFITEQEAKDLKAIVANRKVFYLCGHSHKLSYSFDDNSKICKIMVGATKHIEESYPIISIGDVSDDGDLFSLKFYVYNYFEKNGWNLYKEFLHRTYKNKLGFISKNVNPNPSLGFEIIQLPLKPATRSKKGQRKDTLKILSGIKAKLCPLGDIQTITVYSNALPVNAGIVIGYALHNGNSIKLQYKYENRLFSNEKRKQINFEEKVYDINLSNKKDIHLCIYIQAKENDNGSMAFTNLVESKFKNRCMLTFMNTDEYDESYNLESTAKYLADKIMEKHEELSQKGIENIQVDLFYNGFWGLALFLGNQLDTTFPIQLYDYESGNKKYYQSFKLESKNFTLK